MNWFVGLFNKKKKTLPTLLESFDTIEVLDSKDSTIDFGAFFAIPTTTYKTITFPSFDMIEERAYHLWVEAGRPECDGKEFWYEAERQIHQQ